MNLIKILKTLEITFRFPIIIAFILLFTFPNKNNAQSTQSILESFVDSYKTDPMAHTAEFGILVGNEWWHVKSKRIQEAYKVGKNKQYTFHNFGPHEVTLYKGKPKSAKWYFHLDSRETLEKINSGYWTAATASAKSTGADVVPFNTRPMEGYEFGIREDAIAYEIMEHFWKKGTVEITRFERDGTLPTHGVDHVGLYTMKDKRIGWFTIGQDEAANAERGMDKGQVPNMIIITRGKGKADFGEGEVDIEAGMSIFIGPYVKHVLYNPYEEPMEGIVILYGDNIDFARGLSYMDLLEKQHDLYEAFENQIHSNHPVKEQNE